MSTFPSYINKEIPEWNSTDLSNWLLDNKFKKISELCKKNNINGYDLFFINEDILKNEFGINSFHERISTLKTLKKLIYAHLKLNIKNSQNGEETTLILDNNLNISLENISKSIGNIFNINPDDIIFKDYSKHQIISPTIKIVELMSTRFFCPGMFRRNAEQGLLNYLDLSGELKELGFPIKHHYIFGGTFLSCPNYLPIKDYIKLVNSSNFIALHHHQFLNDYYISRTPKKFRSFLKKKY